MADLGVSALISLALHIKKTSEIVKYNKKQCLDLAERAHDLVQVLRENEKMENNPKSFSRGIEKLRTILNSAKDLIDNFTDEKFFMKFWRANQASVHFKDTHESIDRLLKDLSFSSSVDSHANSHMS